MFYLEIKRNVLTRTRLHCSSMIKKWFGSPFPEVSCIYYLVLTSLELWIISTLNSFCFLLIHALHFLLSPSFFFVLSFLSFLFKSFSGRDDDLWEQRALLIALTTLVLELDWGTRETSGESHILIVTHWWRKALRKFG